MRLVAGVLVVLACAVACASSSAAAAAAGGRASVSADPTRVVALPGLPDSLSSIAMYSGYITVDAGLGRRLFYWLIEAIDVDPASAPIVLWLGGGPGCSSFYGTLAENGPFWPNANGTLNANHGSWARLANVLYVESPAGVGFSPLGSSTAGTNDSRTANELHTFLSSFVALYPRYRDRDWFISGESYAGHYVPWITWTIVHRNTQPQYTHFRVRGFLVGNPYTAGREFDDIGELDYLVSRGILTQDWYEKLAAVCTVSKTVCSAMMEEARVVMGGVDYYNIYSDNCVTSERRRVARRAPGPLVGGRHDASRKQAHTRVGESPFSHTPACIDDYVHDYLNRVDVQQALHIDTPPRSWQECDDAVWTDYSQFDYGASVVPLYKDLIERGLRITIFSGDVDAVVPFTSTQKWLPQLDLTPVALHVPWTVDGQLSGYVFVYDKLNFTTIHGSGHEVPGDQPARAFHMFRSYLADTALWT